MKFFATLALTASAAFAVTLENVIDLCPEARSVSAINTIPSYTNIQNLAAIENKEYFKQALASKIADKIYARQWETLGTHEPVMSCTCDMPAAEPTVDFVGSYPYYNQQLFDEETIAKVAGLIRLASLEEQLPGNVWTSQWQQLGEADRFENLNTLTKMAALNRVAKLGAFENLDTEALFAAKDLMTRIGSLEDVKFVGAQPIFNLAATRYLQRPGFSYDLQNVGVIERENIMPSMTDRFQEVSAMIPGADLPLNQVYVTRGASYVPDSFTPGSYGFDSSCRGQAVTTYPERNSEVLWCGERNLQGNQTLKRTNIHHNYVHDINHMHNYHNRTRHAAKQFDTVEKDCSCKGVAVEAQYDCPPGIEGVSAVPIGNVNVFDRRVAGSIIKKMPGDYMSKGVSCSCTTQ